MLFDSHSHFNNEDITSREGPALFNMVDEAVQAGKLSYAMDIGFNLESSIMAAEHAKNWEWCYAAVGCHPHDAKTMNDEKLEAIRELAKDEKVMAIGEIGLDFHYDLSERDVQREWFRKQIRLANELRMPIVIHARDADKEVMDILVEEGAFSDERKSWFPTRPDREDFVRGNASGKRKALVGTKCDREDGDESNIAMIPDARVLLHCFSGSAEIGKEYVKLGATISVAGPVTYKNNRKTVEMVSKIPIDFLLVETDSPYLTPVPHRGKRNNPTFVEHTARRVAVIKGLSLEETARITCNNAKRFYGIK